MTNEVDLFADEPQPTSSPSTPAESAAPAAKPAARRKKRRSLFDDPVVYWMAMGAGLIVILWTAAAASAIVFGLTNPPAPRTYMERQLSMLDGVVKTTPQSTKAWSDYAAALITAKQYSAADKVIERGLKVAPEKSLIMVQQARLARAQGDKDEALKYAQLAVKTANKERGADSKRLESSGTRARLNTKGLTGALIIVAELKADKKDYKGAIKAWNQYLPLEPGDCAALIARGDAYAKLGDKANAAHDYREALKYIPNMPEALKGLKAIGASAK